MSRSLADKFSVDDSIQNLSTRLASLVLCEIFGMLNALLACAVAVVEGMNFGVSENTKAVSPQRSVPLQRTNMLIRYCSMLLQTCRPMFMKDRISDLRTHTYVNSYLHQPNANEASKIFNISWVIQVRYKSRSKRNIQTYGWAEQDCDLKAWDF